ncbi:ATP-binding cassette domain-containing protein, partial [Cytophagia bacterium]|nr:ATP-binding cassette domain-containing protein [Cytophagia bacterium]
MLSVRNISKSYVDHKALDNVSLDIRKGSIFGLLGPNGAGKTSMIRIINQIINQDEGDIFIDEKKITYDDVRKIGYMPEERGLYKKMKV